MSKIISIKYNIPPDIFKEGIEFYYKKHVRIKNIIMISILILIFFDFLYSIYKDPNNSIAYFLAITSISLVFVKIFHDYRNKKRIISAALEFSDQISLDAYEDKITIKSENSESQSTILFSEKRFKVYKLSRLFVIISDCYYIVPSEAFGDDIVSFTEMVKNKLDKNFVDCIK